MANQVDAPFCSKNIQLKKKIPVTLLPKEAHGDHFTVYHTVLLFPSGILLQVGIQCDLLGRHRI